MIWFLGMASVLHSSIVLCYHLAYSWEKSRSSAFPWALLWVLLSASWWGIWASPLMMVSCIFWKTSDWFCSSIRSVCRSDPDSSPPSNKGGITLNLLSVGIIFLGVVATFVIHLITGISGPDYGRNLSGAVTNTLWTWCRAAGFCRYARRKRLTKPSLWVMLWPIRWCDWYHSLDDCGEICFSAFLFDKKTTGRGGNFIRTRLRRLPCWSRTAIFGVQTIGAMHHLMEHRDFVVSRILYAENNKIEIATADGILHENDKIFLITTDNDADTIEAFFGTEINMERKPNGYEWRVSSWAAESWSRNRRSMAKRLGHLNLRQLYGINITRLNRAGVDLVASSLQVGDPRECGRNVETAVENVAKLLGNSMRRLNEPNLLPSSSASRWVFFLEASRSLSRIPQPVSWVSPADRWSSPFSSASWFRLSFQADHPIRRRAPILCFVKSVSRSSLPVWESRADADSWTRSSTAAVSHGSATVLSSRSFLLSS